MPPTGIVPKPTPTTPNATISDAIEFTKQNPSGISHVINAAKWLVGFFAALLAKPKPLL